MSNDIEELMGLLKPDDERVYVFYWDGGLFQITLDGSIAWTYSKTKGYPRGLSENRLARSEPVVARILQEIKDGGASRRHRIYSEKKNEWIIYEGDD